MGLSGLASLLLLIADIVTMGLSYAEAKEHDYGDALAKSILFFEGQRSGELPSTQRMTWRKSSGLQDGSQYDLDLVGGYYDAGDNVKFNFPMAFSTTMLAWSVFEFGKFMDLELEHAKEAIKWATDYLLKCTRTPGVVYVQVGDPYEDHNCWQRPEDMDTPPSVFSLTPQRPGSEVAAETAAALAASSIIFRSSDPAYSQELLNRAMEVFDFADRYRGSYSSPGSLGSWVCPFYCDWSGYEDELNWGAAWLYKASNNTKYWNYLVENIPKLRYHQAMKSYLKSGEFGWDDKVAGINVLMASGLPLMNNDSLINQFNLNADDFVCKILPESSMRSVNYSQGGLLFKPGGSNMQHTTAISFLLLVYANQLNLANDVVRCGDITANPQRLIALVKGQVDYILGDNPMNMSYMVGYGEKFPFKIHHRGSSLPSMDEHPDHISCKGGTPYFLSEKPNPNLLTGAVVGGPYPNDTYPDSRPLFAQTEPTTYINAPLVGVLAFFKAHTNKMD